MLPRQLLILFTSGLQHSYQGCTLGKAGIILLLNIGLLSWEAALGIRVPGSMDITEKSRVCLLEQFELICRKSNQNTDIKSVLCLLSEQVTIPFVRNIETKSFCPSSVSNASLALCSVKLTLHSTLASFTKGSTSFKPEKTCGLLITPSSHHMYFCDRSTFFCCALQCKLFLRAVCGARPLVVV